MPTLRHVLVIGVDGVRFDLLGPAVTPVIWGFTRNGFLTPVAGHGITGNNLTGHRLAEHRTR